MAELLDRFGEKFFGGHIRFKLLGIVCVFYGHNAMHYAVNIRTRRSAWACFHPPADLWGVWWPWYFYVSRDATPTRATFGCGPGYER